MAARITTDMGKRSSQYRTTLLGCESRCRARFRCAVSTTRGGSRGSGSDAVASEAQAETDKRFQNLTLTGLVFQPALTARTIGRLPFFDVPLFLARGGAPPFFADGLHVFSDSGSIAVHRARAGPPVPRSPTGVSRALAMITAVRCERYDAISRTRCADASDDEGRQRSCTLLNASRDQIMRRLKLPRHYHSDVLRDRSWGFLARREVRRCAECAVRSFRKSLDSRISRLPKASPVAEALPIFPKLEMGAGSSLFSGESVEPCAIL